MYTIGLWYMQLLYIRTQQSIINEDLVGEEVALIQMAIDFSVIHYKYT